MFPASVRITAIALLVLVSARSAGAQGEPATKPASPELVSLICGFPSVDPTTLRYKDLKVSDLETQIAINKLLEESGIKTTIPTYIGPVAGVAAVVADKRQLLVYNPDYLRNLSKNAGNNWAVISLLAHAIGHHADAESGTEIDALKDKDKYFARELRADAFSGTLLRKLGASLEDSLAAALAVESSKAPYPTREKRVAAISKGYNDQKGVEAKATVVAAPNRTPQPPSPATTAATPSPPSPGPTTPGSAKEAQKAPENVVPCTHYVQCPHLVECQHLEACTHLERKRPIHGSHRLHDYDTAHPLHTLHLAHILVDAGGSPAPANPRVHDVFRASLPEIIFLPPDIIVPDREKVRSGP